MTKKPAIGYLSIGPGPPFVVAVQCLVHAPDPAVYGGKAGAVCGGCTYSSYSDDGGAKSDHSGALQISCPRDGK
jgi:hypothetical protein